MKSCRTGLWTFLQAEIWSFFDFKLFSFLSMEIFSLWFCSNAHNISLMMFWVTQRRSQNQSFPYNEQAQHVLSFTSLSEMEMFVLYCSNKNILPGWATAKKMPTHWLSVLLCLQSLCQQWKKPRPQTITYPIATSWCTNMRIVHSVVALRLI